MSDLVREAVDLMIGQGNERGDLRTELQALVDGIDAKDAPTLTDDEIVAEIRASRGTRVNRTQR